MGVGFEIPLTELLLAVTFVIVDYNSTQEVYENKERNVGTCSSEKSCQYSRASLFNHLL